MNEILKKKVNSYAMAAGCFLLTNNEASGQVIYTDADPDIILDEGSESAEIDMNDDGISDFVFKNNSFLYYDTSWLSIRTMKNILAGPDEIGNALAGISNYFNTGYNGFTWYYPFALEQYAAINEELTWQSIETQLIALRVYSDGGAIVAAGVNCYWSETETNDKYLGAKFLDLESQLHYGWIRCDVLDEGRTLIIKDYAYEVEPDYPLSAGDTAHFVSTVENNNAQPLITSFENTIHIYLNDLISGLEIHVYDITGKEVYSERITNQFTQIEMVQAKGTYIVELISAENKYSKKIFIN